MCRRPNAHSRSTERYTGIVPAYMQINATIRYNSPETVQCCLLRLQSVLLYCLSVLLSAGMLRQYFVCLSVFFTCYLSPTVSLYTCNLSPLNSLIPPTTPRHAKNISLSLSLCNTTTLIPRLSTSNQFTFS